MKGGSPQQQKGFKKRAQHTSVRTKQTEQITQNEELIKILLIEDEKILTFHEALDLSKYVYVKKYILQNF